MHYKVYVFCLILFRRRNFGINTSSNKMLQKYKYLNNFNNLVKELSKQNLAMVTIKIFLTSNFYDIGHQSQSQYQMNLLIDSLRTGLMEATLFLLPFHCKAILKYRQTTRDLGKLLSIAQKTLLCCERERYHRLLTLLTITTTQCKCKAFQVITIQTYTSTFMSILIL